MMAATMELTLRRQSLSRPLRMGSSGVVEAEYTTSVTSAKVHAAMSVVMAKMRRKRERSSGRYSSAPAEKAMKASANCVMGARRVKM